MLTPSPAESEHLPDLTDPRSWQRAQADLAVPLAGAASALGALDALVQRAPWLPPRLALIEVETMLWAQGTLLRREDIGRDLMAARMGADLHGLVQARWAVRRMIPGGFFADLSDTRPAPDLRDLRRFLGLHRALGAALPDDLVQRPCGDDFDAAAQGFAAAMEGLHDLHPISAAAAALPLWRLAGVSAIEDVVEAGTYAALRAVTGLETLGFAPLGGHGRQVWRAGGAPRDRLALWYRAVRRGALDGIGELRRLEGWAASAHQVAAGLKGGTPARLVDLALRRPLVSTQDAETLLEVSRDTAERGLARLQELGILREITGRGRFRLWTAAL